MIAALVVTVLAGWTLAGCLLALAVGTAIRQADEHTAPAPAPADLSELVA